MKQRTCMDSYRISSGPADLRGRDAQSMAAVARASGRRRAVVRGPDLCRWTPGSSAAEPGVGFGGGGDYRERLDRESVRRPCGVGTGVMRVRWRGRGGRCTRRRR